MLHILIIRMQRMRMPWRLHRRRQRQSRQQQRRPVPQVADPHPTTTTLLIPSHPINRSRSTNITTTITTNRRVGVGSADSTPRTRPGIPQRLPSLWHNKRTQQPTPQQWQQDKPRAVCLPVQPMPQQVVAAGITAGGVPPLHKR
jgi:hypothetical protein